MRYLEQYQRCCHRTALRGYDRYIVIRKSEVYNGCYMDRIERYTFKFVGLFDSSHDDVELNVPEQVKGVKVTLGGDYHGCEQSAMAKIHKMIEYFDDDFKMDGSKEIRMKLVHVDYTAALDIQKFTTNNTGCIGMQIYPYMQEVCLFKSFRLTP